jgi:membrane protease YdiL (CAAX protease family)
MTERQITWINIARACLAATIFAFVAGNLSTSLAGTLVQMGGPWFLREPINVLLALLFLVLWNRWQPLASYSKPAWGHVAVGLAIGLTAGIILPGIALWTMAVTGAATLKPPEVESIALLVPFIFLILHGFAEESLLRSIAQRTAHHGLGALWGVGIGAICFCVLQCAQGYVSVWNIINSLLFGTSLGFFALGWGGIWSAVGAHAGWSWLETAALGQPGQIVKSSSWLGGSGPDSYGSPVFTGVLLLAIAVQLALHLRSQKSKVE